jgi:hypothetical protein
LTEFFTCALTLASTLVLISVVEPWLLVGIGPIMVVYFLVYSFFRKSFIEL